MTAETGTDLLAWVSSLPPGSRDAAIEARLGIAERPPPSAPPGEQLIGYHASGVSPIVRALSEVPVGPSDVVVDVGAGLGKVALLAHLFTGATARGIEIQAGLVERARDAAERLGLHVTFTHGDARTASLTDGTVFFLYAPFDGAVLIEVVSRLHEVARRHAIVVCALGIDLPRSEGWLVPRPSDAFWLTVYDSVVPSVRPRAEIPRGALGSAGDLIALELPAP